MNNTIEPTTKYDDEQIARELTATAEGRAYYGNALYVAQDMPQIVCSLEHRAAIKRYLVGNTESADHIRLLEAALMIRGTWKPEPQYPEHKKMKAIAQTSQAQGDFIDWLHEKGITLASYGEDDRLHPIMTRTEALLAEFHGIDLITMDEEKHAMLTELRFVKAN
jgi:hypothetical protein